MMKWYRDKGKWAFRPNFIIQYPDVTGADRSVPVQFSDTVLEIVRLPTCKVKGFWRIKWKETMP